MEFGIRASEFGKAKGRGLATGLRHGHSPVTILHSPFAHGPWIKVCGVRTFADLEACAAAGATHVGLNAWPRSPRFVDARAMRSLVRRAGQLDLVPVVVTLPGSAVGAEEAARMGAPLVQLLEAPSAALGRLLARRGTALIEARRATPATVSAMPWGAVLLLDACEAGLPGGTGTPVAPHLALAAPRPFVLAGGLGPENVAEAIATFRPAGVDAASGLESAPGRKDHGKIFAFCAAARGAFAEVRSKE